MRSGNNLVVHVPRRYTRKAWGGTERVLEQTLPLLADYGFNSCIYTTQALDDSLVDQVAGIPISRFRYFYPEWPLSHERKRLYDNKGGDLLSPSLASSIAELDGLSLVHLHTGSLLGAQCHHVAKLKKLPTVITLHGGYYAIPADELESLSYRTEYDPPKGFRLRRLVSLFLRTSQLLEHVDAVICVGIEEYEAARQALPGKKVYFIPGGVNLQDFSNSSRVQGREILNIGQDRLLIICVARVDRQKDQETLIKAWARHCPVDCDLALIGPETTPGYVEELNKLVDRSKRRHLHVLGGIDPSLIPHVYAAGDLSVLPSRHEPFGLTCLESWAAGIPLVASDAGGPGWLLKDGKEGQLFPVGDERKLGQLITELLKDSTLRESFASNGLKRVKREFSWLRQVEQISDVYESVMSKFA